MHTKNTHQYQLSQPNPGDIEKYSSSPWDMIYLSDKKLQHVVGILHLPRLVFD